MFETFHFLRPLWLLAIPAAAILLIIFYQRSKHKSGWEKVCDPALLNFQLAKLKDVHKPSGQIVHWIFPLVILLTLFSLSGPSWEKKEQPVFQQGNALVIVLDLSLSMNATDIKPSRLERAKLKIIDILKQKKEGQTALVAYSGDAHTVSPLTIDNKTIMSLLPALDSSIMPLSGSNVLDSMQTARELLKNAGFTQGDILLFTDGIDPSQLQKVTQTVKDLYQQGYRVSIIGIGSHSGSPVPVPGQGGFFKDRSGQVVLSKLEDIPLKKLSQAGGGFYHTLALDDSDFKAVLKHRFSSPDLIKEQDDQLQQWVDAGAYVIILIIPLALVMFRKGLLSLVLLLFLVPALYNNTVYAQVQSQEQPKDTASPSWKSRWKNLWLTPDQQAENAFNQQQYQQAGKTFKDPLWKASALYRAGNYQQALEQYGQFNNADALYNKGNTLANLKKFPEAIDAYNKALKLDPELKDAQKNRDYINKLLEQQKQQSRQNSKNSQDQSQKKSAQNKSSDNSNKKEDSKSGQSAQQKQQQGSDDKKNGSESQTADKDTGKKQDKHQQGDQQKNQQNKQKKDKSSQNQAQNKPDRQQDSKSDKAQGSEATKPEELKNMTQTTDNAQQPSSRADDKDKDKNSEEPQSTTDNVLSQLSQEEQQSLKQWLQRIPDNPGELLRIKFRNNTLLKQRKNNAPQKYEGTPW